MSDLPRIQGVPDDLIRAINDRLRKIRTDATASTASLDRTIRRVTATLSTPAPLDPLLLSYANTPGQIGVPYSMLPSVSGGTAPYGYAVTAGSLAGTGLTLDTSTGEISGTPTTAGFVSITVRATDSATTPAAVEFPVSINIVQPSGASVLLPIATAVGRDVGHGTDAPTSDTRLVYFQVGVKATFASAPKQYGTVYLSRDGGTNWFGIGWYLWTSSGQEWFFSQVRPAAVTNWKVAIAPGTIAYDTANSIPTASLPTGTVQSSAFSVAALAVASPTLGTNPTPGAGGAGSWPYNKQTPDGSQYWSIPSFTLALATAYTDPNAWVINTTFQDLDSSHNAVGPEHIYGDVEVVNGSVNIGKLDGDYGTNGYSYTRTGNIAYVRMKVYASNRVDQTTSAWSNPAASTLQTDVGSGAGYVDILVAAGGALPPGKVLGSRMDPNSLEHMLQLDPTTGNLTVPNTNTGMSILADPSFEFSTVGVIISGGVFVGTGNTPKWNIAGTTVEVMNTGGNSGAKFVRMTGPSSGVYQYVACQGGRAMYFEIAVRSSNTGGTHATYAQLFWFDGAGVNVGSATIMSASGYIAGWTLKSGIVTAPATAASVQVKVQNDGAETAGGYWDVDDILIQEVTNQTANGQTQAMIPASSSGDYSALRALSTTDNSKSYYGKNIIELDAPNSDFFAVQVGSGFCTVVVSDAAQNNLIALQMSAGVPSVLVKSGGTAHTGFTGAVAGRSAIGGVVI